MCNFSRDQSFISLHRHRRQHPTLCEYLSSRHYQTSSLANHPSLTDEVPPYGRLEEVRFQLNSHR